MKKFFSLGLVRGLGWQILGTAFGIGFVTLVRWLMKLPAWKAEPAIVFGALIGALAFLYGIGILDDWIRQSSGKEVHDELDDSHLGWRRYFGVSLDHKVIGIQYLAFSILLMGVGG